MMAVRFADNLYTLYALYMAAKKRSEAKPKRPGHMETPHSRYRGRGEFFADPYRVYWVYRVICLPRSGFQLPRPGGLDRAPTGPRSQRKSARI